MYARNLLFVGGSQKRSLGGLQAQARSGVQGACEDGPTLMLVTEYMEGGDLHTALRRGTVIWHKRCAIWPQKPNPSAACRDLLETQHFASIAPT